jgi:hypothetical protein
MPAPEDFSSMVEYLEIDGLYAFVRWAVENLRVGIFPILSIWSPLVAISRGRGALTSLEQASRAQK